MRLLSAIGAALAVAAALAPPAATGSRPAASRPNVVLIVVDTLRADALGAYDPRRREISPEIDALAAAGVLVAHVTVQSSWTRPSIGSLLTGRYPRSLGLYREAFDLLDDRFTTLAEVLRANGYQTVGATANPNLNRSFNFDQGFDRYGDSRVVFDWMRAAGGQETVGPEIQLPDSGTILDRLLAFASSPDASPPAYLQVNLMEVHEGWPLVRPEFRGDDHGLVGVPKGYWDATRQISHDLGRFVTALSSTPGWSDTLFVVTSDHGQGLDDHPHVPNSSLHGLQLYQSQVRAPLILYRSTPAATGSAFPLPRGAVVETPVRLMDLVPTLLEYLQIPVPAEMDGLSFLDLLRGGAAPEGLPEYFVAETRYRGVDRVAVYSPEWAYIENRDQSDGSPPIELQRIGEREDGALTSRARDQPGVARRFRDHLRDWEERFPAHPSRQPLTQASTETIEQLRALGYVE